MKRDFQKLLKALEEEELREELQMLYDRFPIVREYYKLELSADTASVLGKYKKAIRRAFFTGRRRVNKRGRSASNKILKEFAAVSIHPRDLIDLHLYRVDVMIEAIREYRIDNEPFHESTVKNFRAALELAGETALLEAIKDEADRLVWLFEEQKRAGWFSLAQVRAEFYD